MEMAVQTTNVGGGDVFGVGGNYGLLVFLIFN